MSRLRSSSLLDICIDVCTSLAQVCFVISKLTRSNLRSTTNSVAVILFRHVFWTASASPLYTAMSQVIFPGSCFHVPSLRAKISISKSEIDRSTSILATTCRLFNVQNPEPTWSRPRPRSRPVIIEDKLKVVFFRCHGKVSQRTFGITTLCWDKKKSICSEKCLPIANTVITQAA